MAYSQMLSQVPKRTLGQGLVVSAQGLGCMHLARSTGPPEEEMIQLVRHAVDSGITFLDAADLYGPFTVELLLGKAMKGIRDKVQIATKAGCYWEKVEGNLVVRVNGTPEYVRSCCQASLKRLDVEYIDLYYLHRVDPKVPIEITVGEMKKLVEEGKVKYLGLSEACASDIRRAHAIHPITAVQLEWSLWARDVEKEIIPTCRELGIGIVAYCPLGRGFFAGLKPDDMSDRDWRKKGAPRLVGENYEKNVVFYNRLVEIARAKKCTPGQVALAWLQHQGEDVVPIPGTTKVKNLDENVAALFVKLSSEELEKIAAAVPADQVAGERYGAATDKSALYDNNSSPPLVAWKTE